jgi:hypothetical protein
VRSSAATNARTDDMNAGSGVDGSGDGFHKTIFSTATATRGLLPAAAAAAEPAPSAEHGLPRPRSQPRPTDAHVLVLVLVLDGMDAEAALSPLPIFPQFPACETDVAASFLPLPLPSPVPARDNVLRCHSHQSTAAPTAPAAAAATYAAARRECRFIIQKLFGCENW